MEFKNIKTVAVIGAGTMGQGLAQSFAQVGYTTYMFGNVDKEKLAGHMAQVEANLKLFQEYDLLKEDVKTIMSRIIPVLSKDIPEVSKKCEFIIESAPEDLNLKKQLFAQLEAAREDNILASNTGSLTIPSIVEGMRTPKRVVGVHYFNPAHIMPLVEIHYGPQTTQETIATTQALIEKTGRKSIQLKKFITGFVVNRLQAALGREALYLVKEGVVSPEDIDIATKGSYGFRWSNIGVFEGYDMIGIDVLIRVGGIFKLLDNSTDNPKFMYDMVEKGDFGIKTGKGFYDYAGKSTAQVLDEKNRKLLRQLALFNSMEEKK
jgi:3-hydroxybutyryl-CoA dehydrogenase